MNKNNDLKYESISKYAKDLLIEIKDEDEQLCIKE